MTGTLNLFSALFGLGGLFALGAGWERLRRRRPLAAITRLGVGGLLLGLAGVVFALALDLQSYRLLTAEEELARVAVEALGPQRYRLELRLPDGRREDFEISGDEWQLDARLLRWHPWVGLIGRGPLVRLERLSGRYRDLDAERRAPRSLYALAEPRGLDLWALARRHPRALPFVDAYFGASVYVPLRDGADYRVSLSAGGLAVRADNEPAHSALAEWL